jgi:hypothetical protein
MEGFLQHLQLPYNILQGSLKQTHAMKFTLVLNLFAIVYMFILFIVKKYQTRHMIYFLWKRVPEPEQYHYTLKFLMDIYNDKYSL